MRSVGGLLLRGLGGDFFLFISKVLVSTNFLDSISV